MTNKRDPAGAPHCRDDRLQLNVLAADGMEDHPSGTDNGHRNQSSQNHEDVSDHCSAPILDA